jgi:dihydrofolate reductase
MDDSTLASTPAPGAWTSDKGMEAEMNRLIAALDAKGGIADDAGIPWQGRIPSDSQYFADETRSGTIVMGYRTYEELDSPFGEAPNLVAVRPGTLPPLKKGFVAIIDLEPLFRPRTETATWIIGGAGLFQQSIEFADELFITQLEEDFHCTKFFPGFTSDFHLVHSRPPITESAIRFQFQIWGRNATT